MVRQCAHRGDGSALLATALRSGRNEESGVLAPLACVSVSICNAQRFTYIGSLLPLLASMIEESLPLGREVAVAGRDTEEERIITFHNFRSDERNRIGLARGVHQLEHLSRQSLLDPRRKSVRSGL